MSVGNMLGMTYKVKELSVTTIGFSYNFKNVEMIITSDSLRIFRPDKNDRITFPLSNVIFYQYELEASE